MMNSRTNPIFSRRSTAYALLWCLITAAIFSVLSVTAAGQTPAANDVGTIHISADALTVPGGEQKQAVFSGNVRAVGDRFEITADQLKIFYQPASDTTGEALNTGNALERIIATGNVVITAGEKIAKTQEAVYDKHQQTIILTGEHSVVQQNNSYISGAKIIMHTDSEAVRVESDNGKRVKAFIEAREVEN